MKNRDSAQIDFITNRRRQSREAAASLHECPRRWAVKMKIRHRAYAYVTYGSKLLLFTHPDSPEAGIQVPAGTVKPDERPEDAVIREATEETGLSDLEFVRFLDQDTRDMRDCGTEELQYRWFYHLRCTSEPPKEWQHGEYAEDGTILHPFYFFWREVCDLPRLVANYDDKIDHLRTSLNTIAQPGGAGNGEHQAPR